MDATNSYVTLVVGNLCRDAVKRTNRKDNSTFWSATVADNKDKNNPKFYQFTVKSDKLGAYLKKGQRVAVAGFESVKQNGQFTDLSLLCAQVRLIADKKTTETPAPVTQYTASSVEEDTDEEEDNSYVPF